MIMHNYIDCLCRSLPWQLPCSADGFVHIFKMGPQMAASVLCSLLFFLYVFYFFSCFQLSLSDYIHPGETFEHSKIHFSLSKLFFTQPESFPEILVWAAAAIYGTQRWHWQEKCIVALVKLQQQGFLILTNTCALTNTSGNFLLSGQQNGWTAASQQS